MLIDSEKNSGEIKAVISSIIYTACISSRIPILDCMATWHSFYKNELEHNNIKKSIDDLKEYVSNILTGFEDQLKELQNEKLQLPSNEVINPIAQGIANKTDRPELQKMYATLFKNASSIDGAEYVHPAFADIINQLSTDEILLMKSLYNSPTMAWPVIDIMDDLSQPDRFHPILTNFSTVGLDAIKYKKNIGVYIDNLQRLNMIYISEQSELADNSIYDSMMNEAIGLNLIPKSRYHKHTNLLIQKHSFRLTNLGQHFKRACFDHKIE